MYTTSIDYTFRKQLDQDYMNINMLSIQVVISRIMRKLVHWKYSNFRNFTSLGGLNIFLPISLATSAKLRAIVLSSGLSKFLQTTSNFRNCTSLGGLNIFSNNLIFHIYQALGYRIHLWSIKLSSNKLTRRIPV